MISLLSQPQKGKKKNEGVISCPNKPHFRPSVSSFMGFAQTCILHASLLLGCNVIWVSLSSAFKSNQLIYPTIPRKFILLIISHLDAPEVQVVCVFLSL